jgi:nicotinate-nucleotide adenylyltransferase
MIGIFGGSFDPPHYGHLEIIKYCLDNFSYSKFYLVPNYISPLKTHHNLSNIQKIDIMNLFIQTINNSKIELLDYETKKEKPSFTIDTINYLSNQTKDDLQLVIGEDNFLNFHKWKDYKEILMKVRILVFKRLNSIETIPNELQDYKNSFIFIDNPYWDYSSTEWRNQPDSKKIPLSVYEYCRRHHLYGL